MGPKVWTARPLEICYRRLSLTSVGFERHVDQVNPPGQPGNSQTQGSAGPGADMGNLWSALQGLASQIATAQVPENVGNTAPEAVPGAAGHPTNGNTAFVHPGKTRNPSNTTTFGGSPVSQLADSNGVIVDGSQTVRLPNRQIVTIHPTGREPMTVLRSRSAFIIGDRTVHPDEQIAAGQTTASLAESTIVLYVNGAATTLAGPSTTLGGTLYTTANITSTSSGDIGGYIYSGVGGMATTGNSRDGSVVGTGSALLTAAGSWIKTVEVLLF